MGREEGQGDPYKYPKRRDCLNSMSTIERGDQGVSSLHPDQLHNNSVLDVEEYWCSLQETGWSGKEILLTCHKDRVTVCPEYLCGAANLRADTLPIGKEAQEWSLGTPTIEDCSNGEELQWQIYLQT